MDTLLDQPKRVHTELLRLTTAGSVDDTVAPFGCGRGRTAASAPVLFVTLQQVPESGGSRRRGVPRNRRRR